MTTHSGIRQNLSLVVAATAACIALGVLLALLVYRTTVSRELAVQSVENCESIQKINSALTLAFRDSFQRVEARRDSLSPAEFAALKAYYDRQFARFAPEKC